MMPNLKDEISVRERWLAKGSRGQERTRIPRLAIGAKVVSGDIVKKFLQAFLVARLLALAQGRGHGIVQRRLSRLSSRARVE